MDQKLFFLNSRKFQKVKLQLTHTHKYLHSIYIELGIRTRDDLKYTGGCA